MFMKNLWKITLLSLLLCLPLGMAQAESLYISGFYGGHMIQEYQQENPEVEVTVGYEYFDSVEELVNAMLFQETSFDIMTLWTGNQDIDMLMEKGYCPALETSDIIAEKIGQMYDTIQDAVTMDGHLYAVPLQVWCTELAYDPQLLEEMGLDVPSSFADMAEIINGWENYPPEISEDYLPVQYIEDYPSWFLMRATEHYIDTLSARGEQLSFDTPVYRELMALQSTITDALNDNPGWEDLPAPFVSGVDITSSPGLHLVPIEMDGEIIYRGQMIVAIINPYSEHKEEAVAFLEWAVQHYSNVEKLYLFPGESEPVENSWYATEIAAWTKTHDALLNKLEACEESVRRVVQDELDIHEATLAMIEADRYAVSSEDIAVWEAVMPHMAFIPPTVFDLYSDTFYTLEFRYLDGELSMEQFITEMERVATMLRMENGE